MCMLFCFCPLVIVVGALQMTYNNQSNLLWLCLSCSESWAKTPGGANPSPSLATCLLHEGGGVPLSALPKDTTSELASLFSTQSYLLSAMQGSCEYHFLKSFGMTPLKK